MHDEELEATVKTLRHATNIWADLDKDHMTVENDPLRKFLPEHRMPTALQFEAVYRITGKTELDRRNRKDFEFTPATESAWCRSVLKRWVSEEIKKERGWFHHGRDREGFAQEPSFDPPKGAA